MNPATTPTEPIYGNQFTREYWRGHEERREAPDYVTNSYPGPVYSGRIGGERCHDQRALKAMYYQLIKELNS